MLVLFVGSVEIWFCFSPSGTINLSDLNDFGPDAQEDDKDGEDGGLRRLMASNCTCKSFTKTQS